MAKLTRYQRSELESILYHAKRAQEYIQKPKIVIACEENYASTTLHFVRKAVMILYPLDKNIGSDITGLYDAVRLLERLLMTANPIPRLSMRKFTIEVLTCPTMLEVKLFGAQAERKTITIEGYTLKDAKKRAGIQ